MIMGVEAYANHRGCARSTVYRALKAGRIGRDSSGLLDSEVCDRRWAEDTHPLGHGRELENSSPPAGTPLGVRASSTQDVPAELPTITESKRLLEAEKARIQQLKREQLEDRLVDADKVRGDAFTSARVVRDRLLSIPERLAPSWWALTTWTTCRMRWRRRSDLRLYL